MLAAMILVGLTGGVASGKTTIGKMFQRCGAVLIDADKLSREVVEPGKPAWRDIVKHFGKAVLNPDGTLNRAALGRIVFRDRAKRRRLERIIHPRVARRQASLVKAAARNNHRAVVVYEVPLLFEAGIDQRVDHIIVVTGDRATQLSRLMRRNRLTKSEALRRIRSQLPLAAKMAKADTVLNGTAPRRELARRVRSLYRMLRELA
ncbi:MAG TPA: dephospho-CoA kinase [Nitrospira sp.]|nr:dephospho-CoA kinase [Nitrospira sp.]